MMKNRKGVTFFMKRKLCLGTNENMQLSVIKQILEIRRLGFDAFFTRYDRNLAEYAELARREGIFYQSVHASIKNADKLWEKPDIAEIVIDEWVRCIHACAEVGVGIMVVHAFRGIDKLATPTAYGVENFKKIVEAAEKRQVKIAVENCEGEAYLENLLHAFEDCDSVGFCWDTGHELCYNRGLDMAARYGKRMIATHLNDNMGVTGECISSADDLHLLPFDGRTDWTSVAKRLADCKYDGILTFELKKGARNQEMSEEEYLQEAFLRACRVRDLLEIEENGRDY
jgi:sugar phosphate isomerase/epimerase